MKFWNDDSYILFAIDIINFQGFVPFDIYVKIGPNFVKAVHANTFIEKERITRYLSKKSDSVWIQVGDLRRSIKDKYSILLQQLSLANHPSYPEAHDLCKIAELCYIDITVFHPTREKLDRLKSALTLGSPVLRERELRKFLLRVLFANVECEITRRAVFGGVLGVCFFLEFGDCQNHVIASLLLGGILRDISLNSSSHDSHKPYAIGEKHIVIPQSDIIYHSSATVELLKPIGVLDDYSESLIRHHHEHPTGNGYPNGLKKYEIYLPALCVHLSDLFVNAIECRLAHGEKLKIDYLIQDFSKLATSFGRDMADKSLSLISDSL